MAKTIISFDIGIKNLAYCIFKIEPNSPLRILKWGIANLMQTYTTNANCLCDCKNETKATKKKPAIQTPCTKKATMTDANGCNYCATHAKKSGFFLSSPAIKKMKMEELRQFCHQYGISLSDQDKKPAILEKATAAVKAQSLVPLQLKTPSAKQIHLVEIGKQMRHQMDTVLEGIAVDTVILENQISPIAGRMNTIQGMLAQYFIMKTERPIEIEFISSAGKLKDYKKKTTSGEKGESTYKDHKKDSILYCSELLNANPVLKTNKEVLDLSNKKDDLADCFLQGIYFMKKQNYINVSAEDLEIKIVS